MNRTCRPRSLRVMHRFCAFFLALVWTVAPALAVLHASAATHRYCAEHDALEEGVQSEGAMGADGDSQASVAGSESGTPHEGCAFDRHCRLHQVLSPFVLAQAGAIETTALATPAGGAPAASVAVIRFAPKTSPPV